MEGGRRELLRHRVPLPHRRRFDLCLQRPGREEEREGVFVR